MIIYSVTVSIDRGVESDWLSWMKETHIPDIMAAGYFRDFSLQKVLDPVAPDNTPTYNIQYSCDSLDKYESYQKEAAPGLRRDHSTRYEGRFTASRAVLETVP